MGTTPSRVVLEKIPDMYAASNTGNPLSEKDISPQSESDAYVSLKAKDEDGEAR